MPEIINSVIEALADAKLPVFHQFDSVLLSKRNDCFITVGLSEMTSELSAAENNCEVGILVSLFAPSTYSGGKFLSMSKNIAPLIFASSLDVKSVKVCALAYDKQLDRLRYDFAVKISATADGEELDAEKQSITVSLSESLDLSLSGFSLSRKYAASEIQSVTTGVFLSDGGSFPLHLTLKGSMECLPASLAELDRLVTSGEEVSLLFVGTVFPEMKMYDYSLKTTSHGYAEVTLQLVATDSGEVLVVDE